MVRSTLQKRTASALLLTTIAVQLHVSGALAVLQDTPVFAPIIGVASVEAQSTGNFQQENADPKYGKTWIVVITCRNAAGQNVTYNQGGSSHSLAAMVRQSIVNKGLNLTQPLEAIVRSDGGTGGGFNWNDNSGTIHQPTVSAVCQILGNVGDTYVSSTCRDNERSGIYPNGKCNFHSPGDNNMHRFVGTFASPQCSDGLDNDGDGLKDFPADPGCVNAQDNDEFNAPPTPQCNDGIDNDNDGAADMQDFSCSSPTDNDETNPKATCQDGVDNDQDGLVDFPNDPGCQSRQDNDEFHQVACPAATVNATFEGNQGPWEDVAPNGDAKAPTFVGNVAPNSIVKVNSVNGTYSARIYHGNDEMPLSCDNGTLSFTNNSNQSILKVKLNAIGSQGITVPNGATRAYLSHNEPGSFNYFDNSGNRDHRAPCQVSFGITPTSCQQPQCRDGLDNDGDGLVDFPADPGCVNQDDNDESPRNIGNLDVEKTLQGQIVPGQNATYVITVRNNGTVAAQNVNVYDYFLDNQDLKYVPFTFVSSTGVTCSYQSGLQQVSCPIGTIQPGTTVTMSLVFNVPANHTCSTQVRNRVDAWINGQQAGGDVDDVTSTVTCLEQCRDGIDNDNDGRTDYPADPGCGSPTDNNEGDDPACSDRIDNDGDGFTDFPADPGCADPTDQDEFNGPPPQCNDGRDNDGDNLADFPNDPGCVSLTDNDEFNNPIPQCSDKLDNDGDGKIDWNGGLLYTATPVTLDPTNAGIIYSTNVTPGQGFSITGISGFFTYWSGQNAFLPCNQVYQNNIPNHTYLPPAMGNFLVTFVNQYGQTISSYPMPNLITGTTVPAGATQARITFPDQAGKHGDNFGSCSVTVNKSTGSMPADPGCTGPSDDDERDALAQCQDGIDNDGDGATDMQDFSCSSPTDNDETNPKAACQDGVDNDQDGLVDFPQDPGCASRQDNDEFNQVQTIDLATQKTGPASVTRGQPILYTLTVRNNGQVTATNLVVTDQIPAGLVYNDALSHSTCSQVNNAVVCTHPSLGVGQTGNFTVAFDTPAIANCTAPVNVINSFSVTATQQDSNPGNNTTSTVANPTRIDCPQVPQCRDGIDNDNDGATDFPNDFSCTSPDDNDETNQKAACQDGIDNDSDGLVDFPQDPGCVNLQDNDEFNQAQTADLSVTKTGPASVTRGQVLRYTITVRNNGPIQATNLVVTDAIPAGLQYNDAQSHSTCSQVGSNVVCTHPSLGANQNGSFTIAFDTPAIANCTTVNVVNSVTVSATQQDGNQSNNTASTVLNPTQVNCPNVPQCRDGIDNDGDGRTDSLDPGCSNPDDNNEGDDPACSDRIDNDGDNLIDFPFDPGCANAQDTDEFNAPQTVDLSITKTAPNPNTVTRGQPIFYMIQVGNGGQIQATNVVVTDQVPAGLQYNDALSYGPCALVNSQVSCAIGTLNAGQFGSFFIAFDTPAIANCTPVTVVNSASISATQQDSNQGNNTSSTVNTPTQVNCPNVPQCRDGIDNDGDGRTDSLDPGCSNPDDNNEGDDPACSDRVDNDGDNLIDFPFDPGCANAQDTDEFNQVQTVDVSITKTAPTPSTVVRGQPIFYVITVGNGGTAPAPNVTVTDAVPAGLAFNDAFSYGPCDAVAGQVTCQLGTLAPGQFGSFILTFDTPAQQNCVPASVVNTATIATTAQDSNQSNNTSSTVNNPTQVTCPAVTQCTDGIDNDGDGRTDTQDAGCSNPQDNNEGDGAADLAVSLVGPQNVQGGSNATYIATIVNNGPDAVTTPFALTVNVPAGVVYNAASSTPGCVQNGQTVVCPNITLQAGQQTMRTIVFTVPGTIASATNLLDALLGVETAFAQAVGACNTTIQVTAMVQNPANPDPNSANNQSTVSTFISCQSFQCSDGQDNDFDGRIDFPLDPGCTSPQDTNEGDEAACQDRRDNDGDGLVDWPLDPGCTTPVDTDEANAPLPQCADGIDNDNDGRIDIFDPGCSNPQDNNEGDDPACSDRIDNDNDGRIDFPLDPGCTSPADTDETNAPLAQCSDGIDNDFDGKVDFPLDPGCQNAQDPNEADDPVQYGCIEIVKQTFDPHGTPLPISAQFTFILDATRVAYNDSLGNARFDNVLAGQHAVAEIIPSGWTQLSITPANGVVTVTPGTNCARITFQNRQVFVANAQCSDGYDNDGDGLKDYPQDTGCTSATDNDEYNNTVVPQCRDGVDNDGDNLVDFPNDPGCQNADDNNEQNQTTVAACADNIDNDGDGLKDYPQDPGCASVTDTDETNIVGLVACNDNVDNDGDGLKDYPQDPGCVSATDTDESNAVGTFACNDNVDNDGDGVKDFPQDPGCVSATDNDEFNFRGPRCSDGIDNDGDGLVDFPQDTGCTTPWDDNEWNDRLWLDRWREWWNWNW